MKSVLTVGLLTLAAAVLSAQDAKKPVAPPADSAAASEKEILDVEQAFRDATYSSDANTMEHLLRLDYMKVDTDGMVFTKRDLPPGPKTPPKAKPVLNAFKVRVYGDLAVVTGGETWPGPPSATYRFIHIWTKTDGHWEMSINQMTKVKGTAKPPSKARTSPAAKT